ncbi:hypothetical protein Tco_1140539 [Tanacetum coccineum]
MAAFWVMNRQFQKFIYSQFTLDYDSQMIDKYFAIYTIIEVKQFRETLLQHKSNVKKSVAKRTRHKRLYDIRVNKRWMQKQESKVDLGKVLDAGLVLTKSSRIESGKQDTSSRSSNDPDADDANIKPVYDEEPMAENQALKSGEHGQILNETSNKAKVKYEIDEIETINIKLEHSVAKLLAKKDHLNKEKEHLKQTYNDYYDSIKRHEFRPKTILTP